MGIPLASNFDIGSPIPIDSRSVVADLTARDAIAAGRRFIGMSVFVLSDSNNYQLVGGILDADWQEFAGAGGGGAYPVGFTDDFDSTDVLLAPLSSHVRINGDGVDVPTIWGMVAAPAGQVITVTNISGNMATFNHEAATVPEDSFYIPDGFILEDMQFVTFVYDGTLQRWLIQSYSQNSRIQGNLLRIGQGSGDVMIEAVTGADPLGAPPYISYDTFSSKWSFNNGNGATLTPMGSIETPLHIEVGDTFADLTNDYVSFASALDDTSSSMTKDFIAFEATVADEFLQNTITNASINVNKDDNISGALWRTSILPGVINLTEYDGLGGPTVAPLPTLPGDLTTKRYVDQEIAASGGGGGANVTLSNLTNPTSVNQDLISPNINWKIGTVDGSTSSENINLATGDTSAGPTGRVLINTGESGMTMGNNSGPIDLTTGMGYFSGAITARTGTSQNLTSGDITLITGDSVVGSSGTIYLQTGAGPGGRGPIFLDGSNIICNSKISAVVDPVNPQDVATKAYVDSLSSSILSDALNATTFVASTSGDTFALFNGEPRVKLANTTLAGGAKQAVFSPNGKYLITTHATTPFISLFAVDYTSGTLDKFPNPASLPAAAVAGAKWSLDGKCLVVQLSAAPWLWVYKVDDALKTFALTGTAGTLTGMATAKDISFTNDNAILVAGFTTSAAPYGGVLTFDLNTTAGTIAYKAAVTTVLNQVTSISVNHVTNELCVSNSSPAVGDHRFYSYNMTTKAFTFSWFESLSVPSTKMDWNAQGTMMAMTNTTGNGIRVIKDLNLSTNTFTDLTFSGTASTTTKVAIAWHPSGSYFVATAGGVTAVQTLLYRITSSSTYNSIGNMYPAVSSTDGAGISFSPNGRLLAYCQFTLAAVQLYKGHNAPRIYALLGGG